MRFKNQLCVTQAFPLYDQSDTCLAFGVSGAKLGDLDSRWLRRNSSFVPLMNLEAILARRYLLEVESPHPAEVDSHPTATCRAITSARNDGVLPIVGELFTGSDEVREVQSLQVPTAVHVDRDDLAAQDDVGHPPGCSSRSLTEQQHDE